MTRLTMLATPDGEWVLGDSEEFLAALGDPEPDYNAYAFAVKNLGFIKFELVDNSLIEIDLHPRNVELPALLAVQQQLHSCRHRLFRIKYFDTAWHSEIYASAEHTINRISELCAPEFTPPMTERFLVERRDFSALFDDKGNRLRPLAQKWRMCFGHFDPSVVSAAVRSDLLSRLAIVGVRPREQEPRFRFIGDGFRFVGRNYQFNAVGEKVVDQPDKEYGGWVSEFYKSAAASGQPRYDTVTASLFYEDERGRPRRVVRYDRLLLPWKTRSDEVLVTLCSNVLEPELDLAATVGSSETRKLAKSS